MVEDNHWLLRPWTQLENRRQSLAVKVKNVSQLTENNHWLPLSHTQSYMLDDGHWLLMSRTQSDHRGQTEELVPLRVISLPQMVQLRVGFSGCRLANVCLLYGSPPPPQVNHWLPRWNIQMVESFSMFSMINVGGWSTHTSIEPIR